MMLTLAWPAFGSESSSGKMTSAIAEGSFDLVHARPLECSFPIQASGERRLDRLKSLFPEAARAEAWCVSCERDIRF